ncbi:MAG: molybdenum cofactor guanylyltransferase [Nostoc sp. ZfuVER08]|jgi:molybdopterin-guanine dinucleotide biosynthesis protein A|uniref:Probable molybdenum cofactor guanylyltransferase n=1 Tax=Nostoc punctiforme FACHB-252 TaxID=1357509 RepID=A0ABR8H6D8_NOSPU|nr:molybdenum cofactor guanylyltransferase [Nostoc punctiforme]MBD2610827.1 molybdenum cofactor guanylyltransferase [Nostoc punctiforme FACHB-252]MDZ8013726.1 molybdenum cofactor guanylyltransferase [Nostoc sp. ZfuVER08]
MATRKQLTAIVLAGGKSSRMGQDKALIPIQGVPLLQQVCEIAKGCADSVYIVTPWPERYRDLLLPGCEFIRELPLPQENTGTREHQEMENYLRTSPPLRVPTSSSFPASSPSLHTHGPLVGFAQGLAQVQTEWVLLLACDLPRLRIEVLQEWSTTLDSIANNKIAALAHHPKGWEPLCGFYRRRCLPQLLDFINQGGRSFQEWLRQYPVEVLPLPEPEMLFNCNTPEDLALS